MSQTTAERCAWIETDDEGLHFICPLEATFGKEFPWLTERVPLCWQHALRADREEIRRPCR